MNTEALLGKIQYIAEDLRDDLDSRYYGDVQRQWEVALQHWREEGDYAHDDIKECLIEIELLKKIVMLERKLNWLP